MQFDEAVDEVEWHNSKHVCKHQYIVQDEQPELFKNLAWTLRSSPFTEKYKKNTYKVAFNAGFKYWRMGNVINRKPITDEEARKVVNREYDLGKVELDNVHGCTQGFWLDCINENIKRCIEAGRKPVIIIMTKWVLDLLKQQIPFAENIGELCTLKLVISDKVADFQIIDDRNWYDQIF